MHRFRRNDIVMSAEKEMYRFYGRVNRRIDSEHVEVIDCGRYVIIYRDDELELHNDYSGYDDVRRRYDPVADEDVIVWCRTRHMPTLRHLKQMAAYYNPGVWRKYRQHGADIRYHGSRYVDDQGKVQIRKD